PAEGTSSEDEREAERPRPTRDSMERRRARAESHRQEGRRRDRLHDRRERIPGHEVRRAATRGLPLMPATKSLRFAIIALTWITAGVACDQAALSLSQRTISGTYQLERDGPNNFLIDN